MATMVETVSFSISEKRSSRAIRLKSNSPLRQYSRIEIRGPKLTQTYPKRCQRLRTINIKVRLINPLFGGHVNIALEHPSVQWIAWFATNKIRPHGPNQGLQGPDFGPLPDSIGKCGFFSNCSKMATRKTGSSVIALDSM